jgi:hypothetical protein
MATVSNRKLGLASEVLASIVGNQADGIAYRRSNLKPDTAFGIMPLLL